LVGSAVDDRLDAFEVTVRARCPDTANIEIQKKQNVDPETTEAHNSIQHGTPPPCFARSRDTMFIFGILNICYLGPAVLAADVITFKATRKDIAEKTRIEVRVPLWHPPDIKFVFWHFCVALLSPLCTFPTDELRSQGPNGGDPKVLRRVFLQLSTSTTAGVTYPGSPSSIFQALLRSLDSYGGDQNRHPAPSQPVCWIFVGAGTPSKNRRYYSS
jgi:hypothetical protein